MEHMYEKAIKLMSNSTTLALSIIDEEGYPKIYAMEKVISEDLNMIIFITKKDSKKVSLLSNNNKCCVALHNEEDSVCLKGSIEIKEDEETMRRILPCQYIERLERSMMQRYCVLIFTAVKGELYIDNNRYHV